MHKASSKTGSVPVEGWPMKIFALAFGGLLGLGLLKFPNPAVVEHLIEAPTNVWEFALSGWPVRYAYPLFAILLLAGVALIRWPRTAPKSLAFLPLAWLLWISLSAGTSIDPKVTRLVLVHFGLGTVCFYFGLLITGRLAATGWFFAGVVAAFMLVLMVGFEQHFGGLEASRQNYWLYVYPTLKAPPPAELLKRMQSTRIFSTLFYANSLAGALLLVTPLVLGMIADAKARFTPGARWLLGVGVGLGAAGCLIWSGSKGGWLIALAMGVAVLLRWPFPRRVKVMVIGFLILAGVTGFAVRYFGFFQRGAPSVVQRFNYWDAALKNALAHPVFGTGPGTFAKVYARVKAPEAEMAKLTHNDYLQQASDSGWLAGALFLLVVGGVLVRTRKVWETGDWLTFGVWLGLMGFALQSFVEFGFYVPATAWCWFGLAGWLTARMTGLGLGFDNPKASA